VNILVTLRKEHFPTILDEKSKRRLESLGKVFYRPDLDKKSSAEDYSRALKETQAEVVLTCWGSPFLSLKVYQENPQLKYMCHLAGTVRPYVDVAAIEKGLLVSNWGNVIAKTVAEGALMMILSALRRTTYFQLELHLRKGWQRKRKSESLFYQRVGLHGLGGIAQELVKLLKPFQCRISAYSPHCPDEIFQKLGVKRVSSLVELFATNRIISIHAADTPANYHLINREILAHLEDGGVIVNTARGKVIDTAALIQELKSGRLEAALDVFEEEPLPEDSELRGLENCLLIPHQAGPTEDRKVDMGKLGVENVQNYQQKKPIANLITPEKYHLIT
jgi:phosphoglycerate dehydrogenase-like enzyme